MDDCGQHCKHAALRVVMQLVDVARYSQIEDDYALLKKSSRKQTSQTAFT